MTITKKLTLGLSLIVATNLMGAKSAPESIGNVTYNKAYITCHDLNNKIIINDTVEIDNIGFDYTKFMPILERTYNPTCVIKGMIELPSDLAVDKVDIEADKAKIIYVSSVESLYVTLKIQGVVDTFVDGKQKTLGRFFNLPVQQKGSVKYLEYEMFSSQGHYNTVNQIVDVPNFFKNAESFNVKLLKTATKRNESAESVQLDKLFIFERKKK